MSKAKSSAVPARTVLAAEDDDGDATLLRMAFRRAEILHPLTIVRDGQEAIDYLSGTAPFSDRSKFPMPSLVLLDLKMPRLNGFDVLDWWSKNQALRDLPLVMLSSSSHEMDFAKAKSMGAREYIVKPHGFLQLAKVMRELCQRWLSSQTACR